MPGPVGSRVPLVGHSPTLRGLEGCRTVAWLGRTIAPPERTAAPASRMLARTSRTSAYRSGRRLFRSGRPLAPSDARWLPSDARWYRRTPAPRRGRRRLDLGRSGPNAGCRRHRAGWSRRKKSGRAEGPGRQRPPLGCAPAARDGSPRTRTAAPKSRTIAPTSRMPASARGCPLHDPDSARVRTLAPAARRAPYGAGWRRPAAGCPLSLADERSRSRTLATHAPTRARGLPLDVWSASALTR